MFITKYKLWTNVTLQFCIWQVLSHMGLQNLKAEVDPSLEPSSDQRTSENPQGCSRLRTHGGLHAPVLRHQIMTAPTKSSLVHFQGLSWYNCPRNTSVSAKDCMGKYSMSSYCLLSAIPLGRKDCTQRRDNEKEPQITAHVVCNQSPVWFLYSSVRLHTQMIQITGFRIFLLRLISGELHCFTIFLEESAAKNLRYSSNKCHS